MVQYTWVRLKRSRMQRKLFAGMYYSSKDEARVIGGREVCGDLVLCRMEAESFVSGLSGKVE